MFGTNCVLFKKKEAFMRSRILYILAVIILWNCFLFSGFTNETAEKREPNSFVHLLWKCLALIWFMWSFKNRDRCTWMRTTTAHEMQQEKKRWTKNETPWQPIIKNLQVNHSPNILCMCTCVGIYWSVCFRQVTSIENQIAAWIFLLTLQLALFCFTKMIMTFILTNDFVEKFVFN